MFTRDAVCIRVKKDEFTLQGTLLFYVAIQKEEWRLDSHAVCNDIGTLKQGQHLVVATHGRVDDTISKRKRTNR